MSRLMSLPPELIAKVVDQIVDSRLPESVLVNTMLQFSLVCKTARACVLNCRLFWQYALEKHWKFANAGLVGRSSDLYDYKTPRLSQGAQLPTKRMSARAAFFERLQIEQLVRGLFRKALYANSHHDRYQFLYRICSYGTDATEVLQSIRERAELKCDLEIKHWVELCLHFISASLGDRILQHVLMLPKIAPWHNNAGIPDALDALLVGSAFYQQQALHESLENRRLIESMVDTLQDDWVYAAKCPYIPYRPARSSPTCTCLPNENKSDKMKLRILDSAVQVLDDYGMMDITTAEAENVTTYFMLPALGWSDDDPADPFILTIVACALATRLGLRTWPIMFEPQPTAACSFYDDDNDTAHISYLVPSKRDLFTRHQAFIDSALQVGATMDLIQEQIQPMSGADIVLRSAERILDRFDRDEWQNVEQPALLAAVKVLHRCGKPIPIPTLQFAMLLAKVEAFSVETWQSELPEIARRGSYNDLDAAQGFFEALLRIQNARVTPVIKRQFPQRVIRYSLGAIVQHVKHGYIGVIDHIEDTCTESEEWQARMRVHKLKGGGANQPFYSVMPATGNSKTVAEVNLKVLSCAACGDRLAGPRLSEPEVPTGILKSTLKEFESHQMLGYYYWRQKNFGCCGYTMSRHKSEHFPTSLWPAHPNACKDRIGLVDDFVFGRGPTGPDDEMRSGACKKQKPSTNSAFNDGFTRDPESEALLRRIFAEVEQRS